MDIDLVYLWCDGNNQKWQEKKHQRLLSLGGKVNDKSLQECRFIQSDELLYSLRSVEKYAPWIRKIFIITDDQKPEWLNTKHPKITVIDHKEIMPANALPCFNSEAIETRIPYIPDLSEFFILANDDNFFWNTVEEEFFFTQDRKPICRMSSKIKNKKYNNLYGRNIAHSYNIFKNKYPKNNIPYFPHHNIDTYRKSYFLACINEFQKDFDYTTIQPFRKENSIQRIIIQYYMIANNFAELKIIKKPWYNPFAQLESKYIKCKKQKLKNIINDSCKILCINDAEKTTEQDRIFMQEILHKKFPQKSQFEL
ncbi:MAG: hypothetical protein K2F57_00320 [Candidatus Gastranaerophilales bacterium]|nr:hypothetical protein [Candidatus Gastranaerophilales bacterium]